MQISWRQGQSWAGIFWGRKRGRETLETPSVLQPLYGEANRRHWDIVAVNGFDLEAFPLSIAPQNPAPWPSFPCMSHIYRLVFVPELSVYAVTYFVLYVNCDISPICDYLFVIILLTIILSQNCYFLRPFKADGFVWGPAPDEMEGGWGASARLQSQS